MDDPPTSMQWMARATEARSLAETMRDSDARSTMLAIAAGYEKLARRAEAAKAEVPANSTDVYRSSNGDRWRLITDVVSGRRVVRHEPNLASGGQITETPVEEFLAVNGPGPEYRGIAATARQQRGCLTALTTGSAKWIGQEPASGPFGPSLWLRGRRTKTATIYRSLY